ncbi:MAG: hypothetical protein AAGG11_03005 [Pseudomonadota bacterium]
MREVDFIFVTKDAGTNVVTSLGDAWEVTSGIRINDHSYAKSKGMNLHGGFITARVKGQKATKSANNFPTGAEIVNAMEKHKDLKVHFGNNSRSRLVLSWKEYEATPSYTDVLMGQVSKFANAMFGEVVTNPWAFQDKVDKARKVMGTVAGTTGVPGSASGVVNLLAGKDTPVLFYISDRKKGGDYTEVAKKRRVCSFEQIAGILAGTDIAQQGYEGFDFDSGDAQDAAELIGDLVGGG